MKVSRQSKWIGLKSRFSGLAVSLLFIYTKYLMLLLSPQCEVNTGHCSDVISLECLLKLSGVKGKTKQRNRKNPLLFLFFFFLLLLMCSFIHHSIVPEGVWLYLQSPLICSLFLSTYFGECIHFKSHSTDVESLAHLNI